MALHKVEEVFVGNTVAPEALFNGTNTIAQIMAHANWGPGDWGIINADTNVSLDLAPWPTVPTWPEAIKFMFYDATRIARFSQRIEKGQISRLVSEAYVSPTPIAYLYDMTAFAGAGQGDKVVLQIILKNEFELKPHKIQVQHTFFQAGGNADIDSLAEKINQAVTEKFPNFFPLTAYSATVGKNNVVAGDFNGGIVATDLLLVAGRPLPDQTNIHQMFTYDFDIAFLSYYKASTNTTFYNWADLTPTVERGSILAPEYNSINQLTTASGNWATTEATNGSGHEWSVRSHYWKALGQMGHLNRVMFESTPYNPILDTTYDTFSITFDSAVRMPGESPERTNQPKQITIYTPNAVAGTVDANLQALFISNAASLLVEYR